MYFLFVTCDKYRFHIARIVHTGMDIAHAATAVAVLTIGKDMTFRDYAQGAYRMRGIGKGQSVYLLIIPEIRQLVERDLTGCAEEGKVFTPTKITSWLVLNQIKSEAVQVAQLHLQDACNEFRKIAFARLMASWKYINEPPTEEDAETFLLKKALEVFHEPFWGSLHQLAFFPGSCFGSTCLESSKTFFRIDEKKRA